MISELSEAGDIGPAEMGRSAVKNESLDTVLHDLHFRAAKLAKDSYAARSVSDSAPLCSSLKPGHQHGDGGEVVGKLSTGIPVLAKEIEPHRLSFPKSLPEFDPTMLYDGVHRDVYADPTASALSPDAAAGPPPRVQVRASARNALELLHFLDDHHRLRLVPKSLVRTGYACGAFALPKDEHKDRLIIDARPANGLECTLRSWCATLGSVQALCQIELLPNYNMVFSGTDLRDYYYCFKVSSERSRRNALKFPLTTKQALKFRCFDKTWLEKGHSTFYPCLATMAMGDNNAVELGQRAHVELGLRHQVFQPGELLTAQGRAPRGKMAAGIVIDDLVFAEQLAVGHDPLLSDGVQRLGGACEAYLQEGLTAHPPKTFRGESKASFWGVFANGESGLVRASPSRVIPLLEITARTALIGYASVALLETLAGSWVAVLQVRRRMLSLLDHIYTAQQLRERDDIVKLSAALVQELWLLVILGPLSVSDLRAQSLAEVFLSDASQDKMATVRANVPLSLARELQRHCLARGTWSRLLSPWKSWQKLHDCLEEEELPDGVPLVSHPLWLLIAQVLQFRLNHCELARGRRHINLLELESVLELERRLSLRHGDSRYLCGSDSQVTLAALVKGRSSSVRLNRLLKSSLATYLGCGMYGNFGFVPSRANVSDDPTRGVAIRTPCRAFPEWWEAACSGDFTLLDSWLAALGFHPSQVAGLPKALSHAQKPSLVQKELLDPLREVQKPEKLAAFDAREKLESVLSTGAPVQSQPIETVSHFGLDSPKDESREQEPDGLTKSDKKKPEGRNEPRPETQAVCFEQVAPPAEVVKDPLPAPLPLSSPELPRVGKRARARHENLSSPLLSEKAAELVNRFPAGQFFCPGGIRATGTVQWQRKGFVDLYSGRAEVARQISKIFGIWVLTFDVTHGEKQDLLDEELQDSIVALLQSDAVLGVGAAPECCSFSRAITPAVRSRLYPYGLPAISSNMEKKVDRGNRHAAFVLRVLLLCRALGIAYWMENPDGSFIWLLPEWIASGLAQAENCFRFDMCRFNTPWRKRTRIVTDCCLSGKRELCLGNHSHQVLRGRSSLHRQFWTLVAQVYPVALAKRLARAMGHRMGLSRIEQGRLSIAACAKVGHNRIGEAGNPGPRRRSRCQMRDPADLSQTLLVGGTTSVLQRRIWDQFLVWLVETFSEETRNQIFFCAPLAVQVLRRYGLHVYQHGGRLYEIRHLYVLAQQRYPLLRPVMSPAWQLVSQWEALQPVCHRKPLPEILYKAMIALALNWKWKRFAGCLMLGMEGIARVGEVLAAHRVDLVLPMDSFDNTNSALFLRVRKPKTLRRGKGRVQHVKVAEPEVITCLQAIFGELDEFLPLFPLSPATFRSRWNKLLTALEVPPSVWPTPASMRGGGAIMAYKRGEPIANILWRMRLVSQSTLEHYLQELAAESFLVKLPEMTKVRIRLAASFYTPALRSLG